MKVILALVVSCTLPLTGIAAPYTAEQIRSVIAKNGGPEVFIKAMSAETVKMAGQRFDDQTELVAAAAIDRTIVYYIRLFNYTKAEIRDIAELRRNIALRNAPSICSAPTASILIFEHGAEYKYIVYSKIREHLFEYTFTKRTCASGFQW